MLMLHVLSQQPMMRSQANVYANQIKFITKLQKHVNALQMPLFSMARIVQVANQMNILI
jgi:hypothetical protein